MFLFLSSFIFKKVVSFVFAYHEPDENFSFVERQASLLNRPKNMKIYNLEDYIQAFEFYGISRHLNNKLRLKLQLPSGK